MRMYTKSTFFGRKRTRKYYKLFFNMYLRINIYYSTQFKFLMDYNSDDLYKNNNIKQNLVKTHNPVLLKKKRNFLKINIFLCKSNIIQRGLRFQKLQYKLNNLSKKWYFIKKSRNLKNNFYQHKFSKKQKHYPQYNYKNNFIKSFFFCVNIMNFKYKYVALYKNVLGIYVILPLIECINLGDKINFYKNMSRLVFFMYVGSILKLAFYDILFIISNIGNSYPKWAVSMGTYSTILNKKKNNIYIQLPSLECKWISVNNFAILGRNAGKYKNKQYLGKASVNLDSKSLKSRSVAKNPVDHPNGGRTRGKMLFKTPWGKVAKKNK